MTSKDFEVHQLLKAYRKGLVSEEFFTQQMDEMCASPNGQSARTENLTACRASGRDGRRRPRRARGHGQVNAEG
jgi:hypothetical protein